MTLTFSHGPLATAPTATTNYRIEGPKHRLLFERFPRRVRAVFAGEVVLDTREGMLLHESAHLAQLYVPVGDVRADLLEPTDHTTHCPFKGDASYWSLRVGDRVAANAVWGYPTPLEGAAWLKGYQAFYRQHVDAWFDEDEEVLGLRDPYHRVDARASSRHVRVTVGGEVVAESRRPMVISETGLPNRYYLPPEDVRADVLQPSATHTVCPYKGVASYHTLQAGGTRVPDGAWFYPEPLGDVVKARGHVSFAGEGVAIEVDGEPVA